MRHALSVDNVLNIYSGLNDCSLSKEGIFTALEFSKSKFEFLDTFDVVYVSPLARTLNTALLLYKNSNKTAMVFKNNPPNEDVSHYLSLGYFPIIVDNNLTERDYGVITGKNKYLMNISYDSELTLSWKTNYESSPPDGENLSAVKNRLLKFLRQNKRTLEEFNTLIITHQNVLRVLFSLQENTPKLTNKVFEFGDILEINLVSAP